MNKDYLKSIKGLKLVCMPVNLIDGSTNKFAVKNSREPFVPVKFFTATGGNILYTAYKIEGDSFNQPVNIFLASNGSAPISYLNEDLFHEYYEVNVPSLNAFNTPAFCVGYAPHFHDEHNNAVLSILSDIKEAIVGFVTSFQK
jgi:hypothetical protein